MASSSVVKVIIDAEFGDGVVARWEMSLPVWVGVNMSVLLIAGGDWLDG